MNTQTIRVIYPNENGSIVLRTEENWDADVTPVSVNSVSEFAIESSKPFFYFKPVLQCNGETRWSCGENFLTVATSGAPLDVYPYFRDDMHDGNNLFLK